MGVKFTNFASTTLSGSYNTGDTNLVVSNGAVFPNLGASDFFYCVIQDSLTAPTKREIVKVTSRSGNNITVVRAQDSTVAQTWAAGNYIELRIVNESLTSLFTDALAQLSDTTSAVLGDYLVGFKQSDIAGSFVSGAASRTVNAKLAESISVKDFGAVGDGVTDDTAEISAAFAYVNSAVGGAFKILFPPGTYVVSSSLTEITVSNVVIEGYGASLNIANATATGITFNGLASGHTAHCGVVGLNVFSSVTRTAGHAIKFYYHYYGYLNDCSITNQYYGVEHTAYQYIILNNVSFNANRYSNVCNGGDGLLSNNVRIGYDEAAPSYGGNPDCYGYYITKGGGFYFNNVDVTRQAYGIYIKPGAGLEVGYVFMTNTALDTCRYGLYADGSIGTIKILVCGTGCWFASCISDPTLPGGTTYQSTSGIGAYIYGAFFVNFTGSTFLLNKAYGARIISCTDVMFNNCLVVNNGVDKVNGTTITALTENNVGGVYAHNTTKIRFNGTSFQNNALGSWSNNQDNGIKINNSTQVKVIDCDFDGHVTEDISWTTVPTTVTIKGNTSSVSNTIASAATLVVPAVHDVVFVTGTTTITDISSTKLKGKILTLITTGACTIQDSANTILYGDFVGAAGSVLTLICDGTTWNEVSRSNVAGITTTTVSLSGDLTLTGAGKAIKGDFSNATPSSRNRIQSSTVNGATGVLVVPNGTSVTAGVSALNSSDPDNAAIAQFSTDSSNNTIIRNNKSGTGTYGDIDFQTDGTVSRLKIKASTGSLLMSYRQQLKQGADVASANNLTLGSDGNYFNITGSTQINLINNTDWQGGSIVYLKFAAGVTVKHNQAASGNNKPMLLAGAVDFVATANDHLQLVYNSSDSSWYELSRVVI